MEKYTEDKNYNVKYGVTFNNNKDIKQVDIFSTFEAAKEYAYKCMEVFRDVNTADIDVILWNKVYNKIDFSKYICKITKEYLN